MSQDDYTPELEDVILAGVEHRLFNVCTALPGVVQSYEPKTQTASVQPAIKRTYDGQSVAMAVLQKVPVCFARASAWQISGPVAAGDTGLLVFSQRSLDVWKKQGGVVDPANPRKFHVSDAVFYPGLTPENRVLANATENLRIENGKARLELTPDGRIEFTMTGGKMLLDTLIQVTANLSALADVLSKTTTNTMLGPQPLLDASNIAKLKTAVDGLKSDLTALKG